MTPGRESVRNIVSLKSKGLVIGQRDYFGHHRKYGGSALKTTGRGYGLIGDAERRCAVFAAGYGQRLRPLSCLLPKPLFPLSNQPLIAWTLRYLSRHRVREIVINLHHLAPLIPQVLGDGSRWGVKLHYSYEPEILETAGGLKKAEAFLRDGAFVVINSDILIDLDLEELISFHRSRKAIATLVLREDPEAVKFGVIKTDSEGRIRQFLRWAAPGGCGLSTQSGSASGMLEAVDPPEAVAHFTGVHILEPEVLDWIPPGKECSITREIYPRLLEAGLPLYGYLARGYWIDIGTPARYLRAQWDILEGKVPWFQEITGEGAQRSTLNAQNPEEPSREAGMQKGALAPQPGIWLGDGLQCGKEVQLHPPVVIGNNCRLEDGCVVGPLAVVGDGGTIREKACLQRSILWERVSVGEGSRVDSSILAADVILPAEMALKENVVVMDEGALKVEAQG